MSARILIVEDNQANMELAEYLLVSAGYAPLKAYDGGQGLLMAREHLPDLIACDLQMPVLNGYEVLEQLRNDPTTRHLVVVAVTALSMPGDKAKVMAAGFDGYLSKPIDPEIFVTQLEVYLPAQLHTQKSHK